MGVAGHVTLWLMTSFSVVYSGSRMLEPPGRASLWRYGYGTPANKFDDATDCGGYERLHTTNRGRCGVCGDPNDLSTPRRHEAGGEIAPNPWPVRAYTRGGVITVVMETSGSLFGKFDFRICKLSHNMETPLQSCLDENLLPIVEAELGTEYRVGSRQGVHTLSLQLPDTLVCSHCLLQWRHVTGFMTNQHSCFTCSDSSTRCHVCQGCGKQVWYMGCADVAIHESFLSDTSGSTTPPTTPTDPVTQATNQCICPPDPADNLINSSYPYSNLSSTEPSTSVSLDFSSTTLNSGSDSSLTTSSPKDPSVTQISTTNSQQNPQGTFSSSTATTQNTYTTPPSPPTISIIPTTAGTPSSPIQTNQQTTTPANPLLTTFSPQTTIISLSASSPTEPTQSNSAATPSSSDFQTTDENFPPNQVEPNDKNPGSTSDSETNGGGQINNNSDNKNSQGNTKNPVDHTSVSHQTSGKPGKTTCYITNRARYPRRNFDYWCRQKCPALGVQVCFYQTCAPTVCNRVNPYNQLNSWKSPYLNSHTINKYQTANSLNNINYQHFNYPSHNQLKRPSQINQYGWLQYQYQQQMHDSKQQQFYNSIQQQQQYQQLQQQQQYQQQQQQQQQQQHYHNQHYNSHRPQWGQIDYNFHKPRKPHHTMSQTDYGPNRRRSSHSQYRNTNSWWPYLFLLEGEGLEF